MARSSRNQTSQIMSSHKAIDRGKATTKPRAKPPLRSAGGDSASLLGAASCSFVITARSIMVSFLPHSGKIGQRSQKATHSPFETNEGRSRSAHKSAGSVRAALVGTLAGMAGPLAKEALDASLIARALFSSRHKRREQIYRVIIVGSGERKRRTPGLVMKIAAVCIGLSAPRLAVAEPVDVVTPIEVFEPDAGDGLRLSPGFLFHPQITASVSYDSNVYNVDTGKTSDGFTSLMPAFVLKSDFSRHGLELNGGAEFRRYFDTSGENSEQYYANALAKLELGYGINVEPYVGYSEGIEIRGTAGDLFQTDRPIEFRDRKVGIKVSRTGHKLELALAGDLLNRRYSDAQSGSTIIDLSTRDVEIRNANARAELGLDSRIKAFVEIGGNEVDYRIASEPSPNSSGYYALGGVALELTSLVDLEVGAGYIRQNFDDPSVSPAKGLNYRLAAKWTPTPQWRFTASADRTVDASISLDTPAIIASNFKLTAERVFGDRLLVVAEAGYAEDDFRASPRKDKRFVVNSSAHYRLTDNVGIIATVGYRDQSGGLFGRDYDGFSTSLSIRAAW